MTRQQVKELAEQFKPLNKPKFDRRVQRLHGMIRFYLDHGPDQKDGGKLFLSFASALEYALSTMRMYRTLTNKLAKLAEDEEDENNSVPED